MVRILELMVVLQLDNTIFKYICPGPLRQETLVR